MKNEQTSPRTGKRRTSPLDRIHIVAAALMFFPGNASGEERPRISQAAAIKVPALEAERSKVYRSKGPLGTITRQLYMPYPRPNVSSVICCGYEGHEGLRRFEILTYQVFDDVYQDAEKRYSDDNGRTWTDWKTDPETDIYCEGAYSWQRFVPVGQSPGCYDGESGRMVQPYSIATFQDDPRKIGLRGTNYHTFYRTSSDDGRTWTESKMIKYEDGPDFARDRLRAPDYMATNCAVYYYNIIPLKGGGVIFPADTPVKTTTSNGKPETLSGVRCFLGKWGARARAYVWTASLPITIPRDLSGYLAEPWLAELKNGRLLLDIRGTNDGATDPKAPGRHWYAVSEDGGKTWSPVKDWRFEDGTQFFSPATMGKVLRHSKTGRLYWFGNISRGPTRGNSPRYPFYVAEIDEAIPAIKRATLTVIDDYDPQRHTTAVQFSNFYVFENRQTHEFEVYLSPYGQYQNVYQASAYKYTIRLKESPSETAPTSSAISVRSSAAGSGNG
jgi:hypothetical protein